MNDKLSKLESLRGFAAAYVFAGHFLLERAVDKSSVLGFFLRFGQEAVILFFIMSGFVIYLSFSTDQDQPFNSYFKRRARRIYPIYIIALVVSWILSTDFDTLNYERAYKQFLGNIFMLQDFSSGKPGVWVSPLGGNVSLWSLSYEWWFYMMFFPINRYIPAHQHLNAAAILSLAGFITYQVVPNQISLFLLYFLLWWSGVELARTYISKQPITYRSQRNTLIYLCALTTLLAIPCVLAALRREPVAFGIHPILEFRHFAACLIFISIGIAWKKLGWKYFSALMGGFALIAPISYAIYVLHYPLAVSSSYLSGIESKWQQGLLYVAITLSCAYFVEVPFQNAINRRFPIKRAGGFKSGVQHLAQPVRCEDEDET